MNGERRLSQSLKDYFEALERLKCDKPIRVAKGTPITNDAVSLEAGRVKGSIKKSREVHADLIVAIDLAREDQVKGKNERQEKIDKVKTSADDFRLKYEAALAREISLLREVFHLKKQLAKLTGERVVPLRTPDKGPA